MRSLPPATPNAQRRSRRYGSANDHQPEEPLDVVAVAAKCAPLTAPRIKISADILVGDFASQDEGDFLDVLGGRQYREIATTQAEQRRSFRERWIALGSKRLRIGFQIILLEHIGEEHWTALGLDRFHLVDRELRDGYGLILDQPPAQEPDIT